MRPARQLQRRPVQQAPDRQDRTATTAIVAATISAVPDARETRHVVISPYKTMVYNLLDRTVRSLLDVTVRDGYRTPAGLPLPAPAQRVAMSGSGPVAGGRDVRAEIPLHR